MRCDVDLNKYMDKGEISNDENQIGGCKHKPKRDTMRRNEPWKHGERNGNHDCRREYNVNLTDLVMKSSADDNRDLTMVQFVTKIDPIQ